MLSTSAGSRARTPQPLAPTAAVVPQLYRRLHDRIVCADLRPGTRLSEQEIADEYGVSRQPVREAFIRLADLGMVEIRPQRGSYVKKISTAAVMDARFVREAVEADVVRLLAADADSAVVADLRRQLAEQRQVLAEPGRFMALDDRFHRSLAEAAGKSRVWEIVEVLKIQMDRVRHLSMKRFPAAKLVAQHTAIVDAIANANPAAAETTMRAHLREILNDLPAIAAEQPEFFDQPDERPRGA